MQYKFRDTVDTTSEGIALPSEALFINGKTIEEQISGYRTLHVTGREALSPEIETLDTAQDGSLFKNKRYPARIITVTYQLIAENNAAFRAAFNQLGGILDVRDAELIFNDEDDKYFIGTPCKINEVKPGRNSVIGSFEILCVDPFKYSCVEYEATPSLDDASILIDYGGTYKAFPTLSAEFYNESEVDEDGETLKPLSGLGDCGYIAFFNEEKRIVQLGDPEEIDGDYTLQSSQTLARYDFNSENAWGGAAKTRWSVNTSTNADGSAESGNVGIGVASHAVKATQGTTEAVIFSGNADGGTPTVNYKVTAKSSERSTTSVRVQIAITAALTRDTSYFGHGYGLKASVYIGGAWRSVTMKTTSDYWKGRSGHTVNINVVVSGLTAAQTALTDIKFKVERTDANNDDGCGVLRDKACKNFAIREYIADTPATYYLHPTSYGLRNDGFYGTSIVYTVPPDYGGHNGAQNFTFSYEQKFAIAKSAAAQKQCGTFAAQLLDDAGNVVIEVYISKGSTGNAANVRMSVQGKSIHTFRLLVTEDLTLFNLGKETLIKKFNGMLSITTAGVTKTFVSNDFDSVKVHKIRFVFTAANGSPIAKNGLFNVKFVKNNCNTWREVKNKFTSGDVIEANCRTGEIFANGNPAPALGALGNDWEHFYLRPGLNQIGFAYSEWVQDAYAPLFKVKYREVFL